MPLKKLIPKEASDIKKGTKDNKRKHTGKDWAILNTNEKFEIIGDDLKARGIIDS